MYTIVRSVHACPMCKEEDAAFGPEYEWCENCSALDARGWHVCPSCGLLNMEPMHPYDQCYDCCDALDAADEAAWLAEQAALAVAA